ncbi:MAG: hypothetical protein P4L22_05315 [Candidatus Babeliales bacterium]|nr:hypothetical protein [Candidatus Babeliales bacterium]
MKNFKLFFLIVSSIFAHNMQSAEKKLSIKDKLNYMAQTFINLSPNSQDVVEKEIDKLYKFIKHKNDKYYANLQFVANQKELALKKIADEKKLAEQEKIKQLTNDYPEFPAAFKQLKLLTSQLLNEKYNLEIIDDWSEGPGIDEVANAQRQEILRTQHKNVISKIQQDINELKEKHPELNQI